ncbi:hypothetical protein EP331_08145 [bacterium]|nr:MAG: hypothetical protein EP331_08145 [bacterium]
MKRLLSILFVITVLGLSSFVIYKLFTERYTQYLANINERTITGFDKVTQTYTIPARLLMETILSSDDITHLLFEANRTKDPIYFARLHDILYSKTSAFYEKLQKHQYRQLHFHLKDNRSFLRLHRVDKFGDDLSDFRPTVKAVNKTQKSVFGFEEGRIFNGFRYVYPLFYKNEHVGSVEISLSIQAIIDIMEIKSETKYDFVLLRDVVYNKLFQDELHNYRESILNPDYLSDTFIENVDTVKVGESTIGEITSRISKNETLKNVLSKHEGGAYPVQVNSKTYVITLFPIINFEKNHVGYLIGFQEDDQLSVTFYTFLTIFISNLIIIGLGVFIAAMLVNSKNKSERITNLLLEQNHEIERLNEDLKRSNHKLKRANKAKDQFFSIISHDLRNPIAALVSLSQLLYEYVQKSFKDNDLTSFATHIKMGTQKSQELLENLLDWSRTQQETIRFNPDFLKPFGLIDEVFEELSVIAHNKEIELRNELSPEIQLFADLNMFRSMIRNLVSNSLKFSQKGDFITVYQDSDERFITIYVKDNGIGISDEKLHHLNDVQPLDSTDGTMSEKGSGLGLYLVKEFIHFHKGEFLIESEITIGTRIALKFPIHQT